MGLVIDTNVFVRAERSGARVDFDRWRSFGQAYIAAITVSELLVGVHRAEGEARRRRRAAIVEAVIAAFPALDFTPEVARTHARLVAGLPRGIQLAAHDAMIAATALHFGHAVLTDDRKDFERFAGVVVIGTDVPDEE